jgi:hypothetical protein
MNPLESNVPHVTMWLVGTRLTGDVADSTGQPDLNRNKSTWHAQIHSNLVSSKKLEPGLLAFITVYVSNLGDTSVSSTVAAGRWLWLMWDRSLPCTSHKTQTQNQNRRWRPSWRFRKSGVSLWAKHLNTIHHHNSQIKADASTSELMPSQRWTIGGAVVVVESKW